MAARPHFMRTATAEANVMPTHMERNVVEVKAASILPLLQEQLRELLAWGEQQFSGRSFSGDESFALMAMCYHVRLGEHAHAVLRLGLHPDSALIARSILEGWWQLAWAEKDPVNRSNLWRSFVFVSDWRLMQERQRAGETIDPADEAVILEGLDAVAPLHLSPKAVKALKRGEAPPPDPYNQNWHGRQVKELADESGHLDEYRGTYAGLSARHHWDMGHLVQSLHREGGTLFWRSVSHGSGVMSVATAFTCYADATMLLCRHFGFGLEDEVQRRLAAFQRIALERDAA